MSLLPHALPTAIQNAANAARGWRDSLAKTLHSEYDARFRVLEAAFRLLEARSGTYYPTARNAPLGALYPRALTGLVITGTALRSVAIQATGANTPTSGQPGKVTLTSVLPGYRSSALGNRITVTITATSGAPLSVSADAAEGTISITHDSASRSTAAQVVAAINAHATAKFMVTAVATTAGAMGAGTFYVASASTDPVVDLAIPRIGAVLMDGSVSGCGITSWTATAITFDYNAASGDGARSDGDVAFFGGTVGDVALPQVPLRFDARFQFALGGDVPAESANAFVVPIQAKDLGGTPTALADITRQFRAYVMDANGLLYTTAAMTIGIGDGTATTTTGKATVLGLTGTDGDVSLTVTDVSGSLAGTVYLVVEPTSPMGCGQLVVPLTFA